MFGSKRITSISGTDVRQWLTDYEKHKCALSTRNRRLHVLKSIFRLAVENGLLSESPTDGILTKRVKKTRWPSLDREHLTLLMGALNRSTKREAKVIALLLLTGARKNELLHARWENLFLQEGTLLVSCAGAHAYRKIWLSAEAQKIFHAIPKEKNSPWIFPGRDGTKPISDIFLYWKELREELGLKALSIRDLRYVFADWQLRSGVTIPVLSRHMGLNDIRDLNARQYCPGITTAPRPA